MEGTAVDTAVQEDCKIGRLNDDANGPRCRICRTEAGGLSANETGHIFQLVCSGSEKAMMRTRAVSRFSDRW
jgi:hypothetical protein